MTVRNYAVGTVFARTEGDRTTLVRVETIHDNARRYSITVQAEDGHRETITGLRPDLPIERARFGYRVATFDEQDRFSRRLTDATARG